MSAIFFLLVLFSPALAFAAEVVQQNWWQYLIEVLLNVIITIFVPVLTTLAYTLLNRYKMGIEQNQIEKIASQASDWAEHKAKVALKHGQPKTPGAHKMGLALKFARGMVKEYKLEKAASEKLQRLIEASLGAKDREIKNKKEEILLEEKEEESQIIKEKV